MTGGRHRIRTAALLLAGLLSLLAPAGAREARATGGEATLELEAGLGYDGNVFLAPGERYFDPIADAIVEPRRRSGFFLPLAVAGGVRSGGERLDLFGDAGFQARHFLDRDLENADTSRLELGGGAEILLRRREGEKDTLRLRASARQWRQTYFDRDTGEQRASRDDEDLGDKSDYDRYGVEARLRARTLPVRLELRGALAAYDYAEVPVLDSLDYRLSLLEGEVAFDAPAGTWITLSGEYSIREFDNRRSRDLEGDLVRGSDRTYTFAGAGAALSGKPGTRWTATLAYDRLRRADEFAGYLDYFRDRIRARLAYRGGRGLRLRAEAAWWRRDYPRAFAFDDPAFAGLSYDAWEASLRGELPLAGRWKLRAEYEYVRQSSTDPRYDYGRHVVFAAVAVEL